MVAKGGAGSLVDLSPGWVRRRGTQDTLKHVASFGNNAVMETVARALGAPKAEVRNNVYVAVQAGRVVPIGEPFRFLHDRIQESPYAGWRRLKLNWTRCATRRGPW